MTNKTYFVSEDINLILNGNSLYKDFYSSRGIAMPKSGTISTVRKNLKQTLQSIFPKVEVIDEGAMLNAMQTLSAKSAYPLISLDRIYLNNNPNVFAYLDLTRAKDASGKSSLVARKNPQISYQAEIATFACNLKQQLKTNNPQIALIDDVIFSGDSLIKIIQQLSVQNIDVKQVFSGICVDITKTSLKYLGFDVKSYLDIGNVEDEICERDFYFGVAQSGTTSFKDGQVVKSPYFSPFGNASSCASIPQEYVQEFSNSCIKRSLDLWEDMQANTPHILTTNDLPEKINETPDDISILQILNDSLQMEF